MLDDRAARRCARSLGIPMVGTLGVVALTKHHGLIAAARLVIDELVEHGLWTSRTLLDDVLRMLGEL